MYCFLSVIDDEPRSREGSWKKNNVSRRSSKGDQRLSLITDASILGREKLSLAVLYFFPVESTKAC